MKLKLRENCKYGVAVPTSMGIRITPPDGAPVHTSNSYIMQATSAESNAVNVSSSLGQKGLVLTNFVQDSPISYFIKSELRRRNIDFTGPDIPQGGPWGTGISLTSPTVVSVQEDHGYTTTAQEKSG